MLLLGALLVFTQYCRKAETLAVAGAESTESTPKILKYYQKTLDSAAYYLSQMDSSKSLSSNKRLLMQSRKWYKRAEPIMIAYDNENYKTLNGPNLLKVEIDDFTDIKKIKPKSYQVLEELLYAEEPLDKETLQNVLIFMNVRLPFIKMNHMIYKQHDRHHLRMIREAIVNVATKGITGFDSPMLANSLQEAVYNYETIHFILTQIYGEVFQDQALLKAWEIELEATVKFLLGSNFDRFDRYAFIKNHTNTQLELVNQTATDWEVELKDSYALNPTATNLFAKDFFNAANFSPAHSPTATTERVALGKALFNDTDLSSSGMSCATCHLQEKAFTDGRKVARGNDGRDLLRNSPTLYYSAFQRMFFWDGMSSSLESQIIGVLNNAKEFHVNFKQLEEKAKASGKYNAQFDASYKGMISEKNIRHAIATYIRSLAPFESEFDKSMRGEIELDQAKIDGFNLFMGKASCATCHFPPAFNGTVPPNYLETEFENLGTPATASFVQPEPDRDPGAYEPYKVEERRHFFKTPTVRNAAVTAPYMHNGVYDSLEQVMKFYNVGGGVGMGLDVPYQTLPADSLGLSEQEIKSLILFIESLTDDIADAKPAVQ